MLSRYQVSLLRDVYLFWHLEENGKLQPFILPRCYQEELLRDPALHPNFRALVQSWWDQNLTEASPLDMKHDGVLDLYLKGTVGRFVLFTGEEKDTDEITVDTVQSAIMDRVLIFFVKVLTEDIPRRSESNPINDLYWALRFPAESKLTFEGQWALSCVYQNLIKPKFGTLETFISTMGRLIEKCGGHGHLVTWNFSYTVLVELFPPEHAILKIAEILLVLERGDKKDTCLGLDYDRYMMDHTIWQEIDSKRWTGQDKADARKILVTFDKDNYIRQYEIALAASLSEREKRARESQGLPKNF